MTYEEMKRKALTAKIRKKPADKEHKLQCACVRWYELQYPKFRHNLFAVPNGGKRNVVTGAKLKAEGVLAGVSDFILLKSNRFYGALLIEMKVDTGTQSPSQKEWESKITADGYKYVVCRSLDEFAKEVSHYLRDI